MGGKSGKTPPSYVANNDYLLSFGPIFGIWAVWRNGNLYGYTPSVPGEFIEASKSQIGMQNFSAAAGSWTTGVLGHGYSGSVTPSGGYNLDNIISIGISYPQTTTFDDYGGSGPVTVTETTSQYLYNISGTAGDPGSMAWRPGSQFLGIPLCNGGSCKFGIGSQQGNAAFSVSMPLSWPPADSVIQVWWGETQGGKKTPLAALGYEYEPELGSLAAGGGATPPWTYPEFSGVYSATQDLGCSGTTPNDTLECQGLYSLTENLQCNPADLILDIILSGNIFWPHAHPCAPAYFTPVCWSHGLDFGPDPTRTDPTSGKQSYYPPSAVFPYIVGGTGVASLLADPPVYVQVWKGSVFYPQGAVVIYGGSTHYQALKNSYNNQPNLSPTYWQPYTAGFSDGLTQVRNYCASYGIFCSLYMDSQRSASDWLKDLCQVANCVAVFNGSQLSFCPLCEVSALGGSYTYVAPTASGPICSIDDRWYVVDGAKAPVTCLQQNQQSVFNTLDVDYADQNSDSGNVGAGVAGYNSNNITICDQQHAFRYGTMIGSPLGLSDYIVNPATATNVGWPVMNRQRFEDTVHYRFAVPANFSLLDPMDLITLVEPGLFGGQTIPASSPYAMGGSGKQDVRIVGMAEDADGVWTVEAERFLYGCHVPSAPSVATYRPVVSGDPLSGGGSVSTPYFFEPTVSLGGSANGLWIAVSGSDSNYGGCQILISTDNGSSYTYYGSVTGNPNMGVLVSDYPDNPGPDTTDPLFADLSESLGELQSWTAQQQTQRLPLALIDHGGSVPGPGGTVLAVPYEIVCYQTVSLTGPSAYTIAPTIFRAQAGTTHADHPAGSVFVDLSSTASIFKGVIPPSAAVTGSVLYFKFPTFNTLFSALQDASDCAAYSFTVTSQTGTSSYTISPSPCLYQGNPGDALVSPPIPAGYDPAITVSAGSWTWDDPTKVYFPSVTANYVSLATVYSANDAGSAAFTNPLGGEKVWITINDPSKLGGSQPIFVTADATLSTTPGYIFLGTLTSVSY